jgi:hypothetical protein
MESSRPAAAVGKPRRGWLSLAPFYGISGLTGVILWWIMWGGSGDISGRVSIVKSGVVEPVANTDVLLVRADEQVEEFRKVLDAYIEAHAVNKRAAAEHKRVAELWTNGQRNEQEYEAALERGKDAARRADHATDQLKSTEFVKGVAGAGLKVFRDALSGKEVKEPKELKNGFREGRTDVNGRYEFKGVPQGKYYTLLRYQVLTSDPEYYWMVPVRVSRGVQTLDLSNSNSLNRDEVGAAPVSPPARQQAEAHQPKWLVEEKARHEREAQQREQGKWQLVQTVFERKVTGDVSGVLNEIRKTPEKFQSQTVVASSFRKDECLRTAYRTAEGAKRADDKEFDQEDGVVLASERRESFSASVLTVRMWHCVEGSEKLRDEQALAARERALAERRERELAEVRRRAAATEAEERRLAKERAAAELSEEVRQHLRALLENVRGASELLAAGSYNVFALRVQAITQQSDSIRLKYAVPLRNGDHKGLGTTVVEASSALYAADADWRKERRAASDLASAQDAVDWSRRIGTPTQSQREGLEAAQRQYEQAKMRLAASKESVTRLMTQAMKAARDDEEQQRSVRAPSR